MANYLVGDIQGCFDELEALLTHVSFNPKQDTLWLVGDLVARGPKSLETLRYVRDLGDSAKTVLGNHDLHLLATYLGFYPPKHKDQTANILEAEDCDSLMEWLRQQPLMLESDDFAICHAGIYPLWDLPKARKFASEVESELRSDNWPQLIKSMYSDQPNIWSDELTGSDRLRFIINAFTRMRFCHPDGRLDMKCKLPPEQEKILVPWFKLANRVTLDKTLVFGHWAALQGLTKEGLYGLDTGCVWGAHMTLLRWEDKKLFTQKALLS